MEKKNEDELYKLFFHLALAAEIFYRDPENLQNIIQIVIKGVTLPILPNDTVNRIKNRLMILQKEKNKRQK